MTFQELNCACAVTDQCKMMLGVVEVGCMVSVAATFFDHAGDNVEDCWSFVYFGNEWQTARWMGKVIRVTQSGKWCLVQWPFDGTVTRLPAWSQRPVNSSNGLPECNREPDSPHLSLLSSLLTSFTCPFFRTPVSALQLRIISFLSFFVQNLIQCTKRDTQLVQVNGLCSQMVSSIFGLDKRKLLKVNWKWGRVAASLTNLFLLVLKYCRRKSKLWQIKRLTHRLNRRRMLLRKTMTSDRRTNKNRTFNYWYNKM